MRLGMPDSKELGYYLSLSQVGMEMVAPIGLGLLVDYYANTMPWGAVIGALVGFVGGLAHLINMTNRREPPRSGQGPEQSSR